MGSGRQVVTSRLSVKKRGERPIEGSCLVALGARTSFRVECDAACVIGVWRYLKTEREECCIGAGTEARDAASQPEQILDCVERRSWG
jgi:hypothetical protein